MWKAHLFRKTDGRLVSKLLSSTFGLRTRHLSWSVNIFYDFIHTFIHSFGGCVRRSFGRSLNREFGELGSSAGDRRGCAVSNKRRGSGSI
jgi:hypothetical protein